ncbi:MAG: 2-oxo acid dehydrogenase subunit E2 [Firmicutes bacterium]|nr:2-oxo acid dehydrogenase subunit E2 [Bacillota bacterium]
MFHVKFADIGEGIHEGVLLKLFFNEGDPVKEGDSLFTLETDKVNAEIPSPVSGKLHINRFKVGAKVHVGDVIVIVDDGEPGVRSNMPGGEILEDSAGGTASVASAGEPATPSSNVAAASQPETRTESVEERGSTAVVGQIEISEAVIPSSGEAHAAEPVITSGGKVLATPVARKMAKDLGVDINTIAGTGPQGRVMKEDIRKAAEAKSGSGVSGQRAPQSIGDQSGAPQQPEAAASYGSAYPKTRIPQMDRTERVPMTMLRKTIAANMSLSKFTIPHTAVMDEIDVTDLVSFRNASKVIAEHEGAKLTYLAFFIKAVISGLKLYDGLNASLDETTDEIVYKKFYNIGIAVDTPDGLMVPVIKDADRMSLLELAQAIEDLSARARNKTLKLEELTGGSFTITNYGAVGASFGVPVIKHPEAGILGVGTIVKKPLVIDDEIVIRSVLPVSLSFDHRIIDGADAGRFVGHLKKLLSNPNTLLIH